MITALLSILSTFAIYGGQPQAVSTDWTKYENYEFNIEYPKNWRLDNSGDGGTSFMIYSPLSDEDDTYNDFVKLNIQPLTGLKMTFEQYTNQLEKDIPFFYQKAVITENKVEKKSGFQCKVMSYSGTFSEFPLAMRDYTWVINEKAYTLSFVAQPEAFEKLLPIATQIMDSFKFNISANP